MFINKSHGGGMLQWLFGLSLQSLMDMHHHTIAWLEEISPEDGG